ncbi:FYVE, RhoGEF and PH domain-containing protein 2-like isoform X2 [Lingula anatina]|uniref:FYVE, RhoGEF and PH domain-containing protein 2-like isoform X2 n=1 Tax=Lingula anatina TaxID=7574 RepID=A0A1S3H275_LINAN|nr:FYVE, RhoGEF and PH domain-containing protein 2-like isoform X2 [Lingula anatina]|eukprot:XP_013379576.1 FYVE, RhoGEF and PH domain-containing protein 2-like isoform X2 [Lingula anatina]
MSRVMKLKHIFEAKEKSAAYLDKEGDNSQKKKNAADDMYAVVVKRKGRMKVEEEESRRRSRSLPSAAKYGLPKPEVPKKPNFLKNLMSGKGKDDAKNKEPDKKVQHNEKDKSPGTGTTYAVPAFPYLPRTRTINRGRSVKRRGRKHSGSSEASHTAASNEKESPESPSDSSAYVSQNGHSSDRVSTYSDHPYDNVVIENGHSDHATDDKVSPVQPGCYNKSNYSEESKNVEGNNRNTSEDSEEVEEHLKKVESSGELSTGRSLYDEFDDWWDDSSFSDDDEDEGINEELIVPDVEEEVEATVDTPEKKLYKIAMELLTTERAYVQRLRLVHQVFHFRVLTENHKHQMFPDDVLGKMFSNIQSLYQFHADFMLPQLEERMSKWGEIQKLGDLLKGLAPFLKLYSDYVKNFDNAMQTINFWRERSPKFAEIIDEIQKTPECGLLTLQHHMLEPIQRVPRYELLLKDYIKKLPEGSVDREDSEKALNLVATAASHSNEAMKKIDQFKKLQEIEQSLGNTVSLINPTRELIKEGPVGKISARNGQEMSRYLFLFNDLLLVCYEQLLAVPGLGPNYRLKAKLDIDGMQIFEGDNLAKSNTFYIKSKQKTLELFLGSYEEKVDWQATMARTVNDYTKKKKSLKPTVSQENLLDTVNDQELGMRAPRWVKDDETTMCMRCGAQFTTIRRRHHCRACGYVVCGKCSSYKAKLQFDEKFHRVCGDCFKKILPSGPAVGSEDGALKRPAHLEVRASENLVIGGYLQLSSDLGKTWERKYFAVHQDYVMYCYKAHQDLFAMTSMPLPGYVVGPATETDPVTGEKNNVFKLQHHHKQYFFRAADAGECKKWLKILEKVVQAELPSIVIPSPEQAET